MFGDDLANRGTFPELGMPNVGSWLRQNDPELAAKVQKVNRIGLHGWSHVLRTSARVTTAGRHGN